MISEEGASGGLQGHDWSLSDTFRQGLMVPNRFLTVHARPPARPQVTEILREMSGGSAARERAIIAEDLQPAAA